MLGCVTLGRLVSIAPAMTGRMYIVTEAEEERVTARTRWECGRHTELYLGNFMFDNVDSNHIFEITLSITKVYYIGLRNISFQK